MEVDSGEGGIVLPKADDRTRLKDTLTLITYHADPLPRFVVDRFRNVHQSIMGEPQPGGAHYLHVEEAAYLVESCQALCSTVDGRNMYLEELMGLMGSMGVPRQLYPVYCACKRAGFIVTRPGLIAYDSETTNQSMDSSRTVSTKLQWRPLSKELRDAFPDMATGNKGGLAISQPDLFPSGTVSEATIEKWRTTNASWCGGGVEGEPKGKKRKKEPPSIRPRQWPSLTEAATKSSNWHEYAQKRARLLGRSRYSSSLDRLHYLLYSSSGGYSHSGRKSGHCRPVARLAVYDYWTGRQCAPFTIESSHSECTVGGGQDYGSVPLLKAYVSGHRISFVQESGESIDLHELKRRLMI